MDSSIETYYIGRIVGSVVGSVVGLIVLIIIAVVVRRRQKRELEQQQQQQQIYYQYPPGVGQQQQLLPQNMQTIPVQHGMAPPGSQPMATPTQQMVAVPIPAGSAQLPQQPPQPGYYYAVLQPPQQAMGGTAPGTPPMAPATVTGVSQAIGPNSSDSAKQQV
ncbi:hypothetical protein BDA99DRAFT_525826 [Phascolomyces articulosus]|uniref:Uncharacterized protein n=1 Tax=Phascolomyces articulosus TaxID=60185 RepID=A0AAD5JZ70_9FUNG|nr:hypothetical protein BDA99DRAFT_525826 [Phascolomyces articulosus]